MDELLPRREADAFRPASFGGMKTKSALELFWFIVAIAAYIIVFGVGYGALIGVLVGGKLEGWHLIALAVAGSVVLGKIAKRS